MADAPDFVAGSPLLEGAYRFAREAHHGPRRRGDTDVGHPVEVARLLHEAGFDPEVVAAAMLHDVVEDTTTDPQEIRARCGAPVADLVIAMTEDASIEPYAARKAEHRSRVRRSGRPVAAIYAADKLASAQELRRAGPATPAEKLDHYERTLAELRAEHPDLEFLGALAEALADLRGRRHAAGHGEAGPAGPG